MKTVIATTAVLAIPAFAVAAFLTRDPGWFALVGISTLVVLLFIADFL